MGLGFGGANGSSGAKPVKSARVVGDVLGRFHPHGDQAAYDALVRMAQDFLPALPADRRAGQLWQPETATAPPPCATPRRGWPSITSLLMDEIDEGTVDFMPNYDGSTEEPRQFARPSCPLPCSTAPVALPWAWPLKFPATTCARWPTPAWRSSSQPAPQQTKRFLR